jgi:hypothetical protein
MGPPEGGFNLSSGGQQQVDHERAHSVIDDEKKVEDGGENARSST